MNREPCDLLDEAVRLLEDMVGYIPGYFQAKLDAARIENGHG